MRVRLLTLCPLLLTAVSIPTFAQTPSTPAPSTEPDKAWTDRIRLSINGGGQVTSSSASQSGTFEHFGETATLHVDYKLKAVPLVDGGVVLRVWKNIGVGVSVSYVDDHTSAAIDAQIPHPFFPGQPRPTSGSADMHRQETGTHIQVTYRVPLTKSMDVLLGAGPSVINVGQEIVDGVAVEEAFPFDTVTFGHAVTRRVAKTSVGFNVGTDFAWTFSRHFGIGGLLRYSHAKATLDASSTNSVSLDLGGLHAGGGLRVRF